MKIAIICIGKTKKGYIGEAVRDYLGRLRHYAPVDWIEVQQVRKTDQSLQKERERIEAQIDKRAFRVSLAEDGDVFTSEGFAQWLQKRQIDGTKKIEFVVGGDMGLHPSIISKSDMCLSLSPMTFTHQMARVILLEQIYRAFTIIRGEPYHHG